MKKAILILLILSGAIVSNGQNHDAGQTTKVKSRYHIVTIYGPGAVVHTDTMSFETYNPAGKGLLLKDYKNNRVSSSIVSDLDEKGRTIVMTSTDENRVTSRDYFYYDNNDRVIRTIEHHYGRKSNGATFEQSSDTSNTVYDKAGNKIMGAHRSSHEKQIYDDHNRLLEADFYVQRTDGKPQKTTYVYNGNLLMETLYYWFDGKLYHRIANGYNARQQLTSIRDSTYDFLQDTYYIYNKAGLKAIETLKKTFRGTASETDIEYTYDGKKRLLTQTFRSNDHLLLALFPLSGRLKQKDFVLKDTYTYDQFGNRLQIISELDGEKVRTIDFLMSYYP